MEYHEPPRVDNLGRSIMIDVLIQTHNEELNLPYALASVVGWAQRIFVVDSGSTDTTQAIAEQHGATFVHHDWEGYAAQKNWALDTLPFESEWILILDADESVTPPLRYEIDTLVRRPADEVQHAGFYINRELIFMGRPIRHCGYFPSWNLRLFKRGRARYEQRLVHEHMIVEGTSGYLKHLMSHEDRRGMEHFFAKHNRYSTLEARETVEAPEPWPGVWALFRNRTQRRRFAKSRIMPHLPAPWVWRFFYMYVLRLGVLDGASGWHLCNFIASYELTIQLKVRELMRLRRDHPAAGSERNGLSEPEGSDVFAESRLARSHPPGAPSNWHGVDHPRVDHPGVTPETASFQSIPTRRVDQHDVQRFSSPWTFRENVGRGLWMLVRPVFFRATFHNWYAWRRMILRLFGTTVGRHVRIRPSVKIEVPWNVTFGDGCVLGDDAILYSLGHISIGRNVVISQYAHLCAGTHDFNDPTFPLLKPPITIGDNCWLAADVFVGPGVTIGPGTVVGARSSVFKDMPGNSIVVGNPARVIKDRTERLQAEDYETHAAHGQAALPTRSVGTTADAS